MLRHLITGFLISLSAGLISCGAGGGSDNENIGSAQPDPGDSAGPGVANPSPGCSATTDLLTESDNYTFQFTNTERSYRVYVPETYAATSASPLVMLFHGWGGGQNDFLGDATVTSEADQQGFILVAPVGLGSGELDNSFNSWTFLSLIHI